MCRRKINNYLFAYFEKNNRVHVRAVGIRFPTLFDNSTYATGLHLEIHMSGLPARKSCQIGDGEVFRKKYFLWFDEIFLPVR